MPNLTFEEWMRMSDEDRRKNLDRLSDDEMWKVRLSVALLFTPVSVPGSKPLYSDEEWENCLAMQKI